VWFGVLLLLVVAVAAVLLSDAWGRAEALAVPLMLVVAALLVAWAPEGVDRFSETVTAAEVARALAATAFYVLAAGWFAAVGVHRETSYLTGVATMALVLFVVVQSFAVFEPLLSGAALFLVLGVILLVTGILAGRARKRLAEAVVAANRDNDGDG
jgi:uncharacterized membrane protein